MAQRNFSPEDIAKMKEKRKTTLVDSLGVTSEIADSVLSIEQSSRAKMMDLRKGGASREDMRTQMQAITEQRNADVKKILSADAYTKYVSMEANSRKQMMNRMGGGRPNKD
ncbi:MAG: hypothetical protein DI598_03300 [Pseudopedobacter saltans]|uniref:Uncharacterized protein n=1 Tax=Pseudopedobacter saltans TaxID=151895 RepID=A0A2W5H013_9SPHI|nr:MAG: hypothetical protein DI598_03300 [Pseudopedobacter saltans]